MRQVTAIVGGSVGSDPYSPRTWSGIAPFLFNAMSNIGLLRSAVGIELPRLQKALLMGRNLHPNRVVWRKHFYFDPAYRRALTRAAAAVPVPTPFALQIGHMFSLPEAHPGAACLSYHDGNLAELRDSGFGMEGVSPRRIDQALRYEETVSGQMTAIFTFSEYLRQSFIAQYRVPADRVYNIGGAVNLSEIPEPTPDKDFSAPRILFIGKEFDRKGGRQLLAAFQILRQSLPTAELHIAGPLQLAELPPGVIFHGHLSKADPAQKAQLDTLFRQASLFVLPSLYEPFGIAPLEAMLYGLPCLVTDAWALREQVTPGLNGDLVEKGSVDDLAGKLRTLLADPDRLAAMGRSGRDLVLSRYTWPAVVNRMATAINTL